MPVFFCCSNPPPFASSFIYNKRKVVRNSLGNYYELHNVNPFKQFIYGFQRCLRARVYKRLFLMSIGFYDMFMQSQI
jgi:hypothetical protein